MTLLWLILLPLVTPLGVGWWVYTDANRSGSPRPVLWGLVVSMGFLAGFMVADWSYSVFVSGYVFTGRGGMLDPSLVTWILALNTMAELLVGTTGLVTYLGLKRIGVRTETSDRDGTAA